MADTQLSAVLATFAVNMQTETIPTTVSTWMKHLILDAAGNAYASTRYEFAHRALTALRDLDEGAATVIGMPARLTVRDAALMNGILIHGLDFDDTYLPGNVHLTASVVPTVLALGSRLNVRGAEVLTACALGLEAGMRVAAAAKGAFLKAGFHPTGLCGAFASVLAASRLLRLNHSQTVTAQGLVLSSASGTMQPTQEGAWAKRMHPGLMASAAITAASLAREGFSGPKQTYEGKYGLFSCFMGEYADDVNFDAVTDSLGSRWECTRTSIKLYPACFQSHAAMNAALELGREEGVDVQQVESIRARIADIAIPLVCEPLADKRKPRDSYAAQFSLPYALACCFARGRFGLEEIEEPSYSDPSLIALAHKVSYEVDPAAGFPKYRSGEVIVKFKNGREVSRRKSILPDDPAPAEAIVGKFMANTGFAMSPARSRSIADLILNIEKIEAASTLGTTLAGP
jgi:2-methylcitrate dehydratase PrpD